MRQNCDKRQALNNEHLELPSRVELTSQFYFAINKYIKAANFRESE